MGAIKFTLRRLGYIILFIGLLSLFGGINIISIGVIAAGVIVIIVGSLGK
jgi:hypothetical protein